MTLRALMLSGGAFRGAFQAPIIAQLAPGAGIITGVSVGAINATLAHRPAALRREWESVDGLRGWMAPNPDVWRGLYSLEPLYQRMVLAGAGRNLDADVYVGVCEYRRREPRMVHLQGMHSQRGRLLAALCSASIPGIHELRELRSGRVAYDLGAGVSALGRLPPEPVSEVDVVYCTPLGPGRTERPNRERDARTAFDLAADAYERTLDALAGRDLLYLRRLQRQGVTVRVWAPETWDGIGDSFDASAETIARRLAAGEAARPRTLAELGAA